MGRWPYTTLMTRFKLAICLSICLPCFGIDVAAVIYPKTYDAYKQIAEEFSNHCAESGVRVIDIPIKDKTDWVDVSELIVQSEYVLAVGPQAARIAKYSQKPGVFVLVRDPEADMLFDSSLVGIDTEVSYADQLEKLQQILPHIRSLAVMRHVNYSEVKINQLKTSCEQFGIDLQEVKVAEMGDVLSLADTVKAEALFLVPDENILTSKSLPLILKYFTQHRIPVIAFSKHLVKQGAFSASYPDLKSLGLQAFELMDKISPEKLIPDRLIPPKYIYYSINLKQMSIFGIDIPTAVLRKSEELIN